MASGLNGQTVVSVHFYGPMNMAWIRVSGTRVLLQCARDKGEEWTGSRVMYCIFAIYCIYTHICKITFYK